MANRFWGARGVIGGAVDLVATVPLWLAPEPISKVATGAIDYVGADVVSTGLRQVWTGRRQITLTAEVVDRSLRSLGVDPSVADQLSRNTDIAMNMAALPRPPLSVANAARAVRVTSVERGLIEVITCPGHNPNARDQRQLKRAQSRPSLRPNQEDGRQRRK